MLPPCMKKLILVAESFFSSSQFPSILSATEKIYDDEAIVNQAKSSLTSGNFEATFFPRVRSLVSVCWPVYVSYAQSVSIVFPEVDVSA